MVKGEFTDLERKKSTDSKIDNFIDGATADKKEKLQPNLSPSANRDYKGMRINFNEYEYRLLKRAAEDANLSLAAFIRTSWIAKAKSNT